MPIRRPAIAIVPLIACLAARPAEDLSSSAKTGEKLSDTAAAALQDSVDAGARDSSADDRAKLLGYYRDRRAVHHDARLALILWMIDHRPADPIAGSAYCRVDADDAGHAKVKAAWDRALATGATDTAVIGNGASFFFKSDPDRADALLRRAVELQPKSPVWLLRLADLSDHRPAESKESARKNAAESLQLRQSALTLTTDPAERFHVMTTLPETAVRAGDLFAGKRLAVQLLGTAASFKSDPEYGRGIHWGNIVLGQSAIALGSLEKADEYLAAAGGAPATPGLAADGPDLSLARDLLARGEKTAVRDYLRSCVVLWPSAASRLKTWAAAIDAGDTPDIEIH